MFSYYIMKKIPTIVTIIFYIICMYIFLHTYYYLVQIDNCPCFHKDGKYEVNIDFMKFFQVLEIFILSVFVFTTLFFKSNTFKSKKRSPPLLLLSFSLFLLVGISAMMSYNVFNLYNNIREDCQCVNSWYRFFLYYQGIVSGFTVFRVIVTLLMLGIIFLLHMK